VDRFAASGVVKSSTRRFSCRVEHYAKYRPGYPPALIPFLKDACGLTGNDVVADVGSGTGVLTEVFLKNGNTVYAIEPNREMRASAERSLRGYNRFRSIAATGERTTLPGRSVDLVAVGRAFHWFEPEKALCEFARILKPAGWVVIIAFRRGASSPFLAEYEKLLWSCGTDRRHMHRRRRELENFLTENAFEMKTFQERRSLDLEDLKGLTLSYSTSPAPDDPSAVPLLRAVDALFQKHQRDGGVVVAHAITMYYKQLGRPGKR
jgi:ubiquinone/menaquinone biosynthesis C-methylase UbiE